MSAHSFASDPTLSTRLFTLLDVVFPGVAAHARRPTLPGGRWEDVSVPFLHVDADGRPIAHVGLLPLPLVINDAPARTAAIHAVCAHPDHRRRGHYRALMADAIAYADARYDTLVLFTARPELYLPFDFRTVLEHRFSVDVDPPADGRDGFRPLRFDDPADRTLLASHLDRRQPISGRLGVAGEKAVFSFNRPDDGLFYSPDLDAICWFERVGTTLRLIDVIAPRIPSLDDILRHVPAGVTRVDGYFAPDRLDAPRALPVPHRHDDLHLMARGPFAADAHPFMIPPASRC